MAIRPGLKDGKTMISDAASRYLGLEASLFERFPQARGEVVRLAAKVIDVATADGDAIWHIAWKKPLFANARGDVAARWVCPLNLLG